MSCLLKFILRLGFTFTLFACSGNYAEAASPCQNLSQASERGKLLQLLSANGFSKDERAFLLAGAEQRLKKVRSRALNGRGAQCGIGAVRAHIFGCMNSTLPSALRTTPADRKSNKALWGRAGLSAREAAFIGMFHACYGSAMETFLSD